MERFFPADVSLRVSGEIADAQAMFPAARQLLTRAIRMQESGTPVVRLFQPGTDGSLIHVFLHLGIKHVYVQPATRKGQAVLEEVEEPLEQRAFECPDMLSGVVMPGVGVLQLNDDDSAKLNPDETPDYAIHAFHPTLASSTVYDLSFAWQDVDRLGVAADQNIAPGESMQVHYPKPSMYSGAMKRVVQALYGIGKTTDSGEALFDPSLREFAPYYAAQNRYDYHWARTDGIHRVADDFWLVRISKDDGVLAMPLPLFDCTTGDAYKNALESIGDVDTFSVVNEFGGLPTGETFPIDLPNAIPPTFARSEAIAAGQILQLLTPADLLPFFYDSDNSVDKEPWAESWGWAFSESGLSQEAHNTCRWYRRADIALEVHAAALEANRSAPPEHRFLSCEHWKIVLTLSAINRAPPEGEAVGSGTAVLTLVHSGLMTGETDLTAYAQANYFAIDRLMSIGPVLRVPRNSCSASTVNKFYWGVMSGSSPQADADLDLICTIFVCFNGEVLEEVKHQRGRSKTYGTVTILTYGGSGVGHNGLHPMPGNGDPDDWPGDSYNGNYGPTWTGVLIPWIYWDAAGGAWYYGAQITQQRIVYGQRTGPFFSTSIDLREDGPSRAIYEQANGRSTYPPSPEFGLHGWDTVVKQYYDQWSAEIGIAFPAGCREGYVMLRRFARVTSPPDGTGYGVPAVDPITGLIGPGTVASIPPLPVGSAIHMRSWYAGLGVSDGPFMPDSHVAEYPGLPGSLVGGEWQMQWKQVEYFVQPAVLLCSASVNAGPTAAYSMTDGVIPQFISIDYYGNVTTHDVGYLHSVPGFSLEAGTTALDVTFVGAV